MIEFLNKKDEFKDLIQYTKNKLESDYKKFYEAAHNGKLSEIFKEN